MTALERAAYQPIAELLPYLGYGEKDSNYDLMNMHTFGHNNYTFIAQYFDDLWNSGYKFYNTRKNGPSGEWCDMTVDWAMCMAFGPENARKVLYQPMESCGAGCSCSAKYYRDNNAWLSRNAEPRTGDQIFFGPVRDETHTGLVERADASYVYTIEGNTSDRLLRRSYGRNESKIAGYGRPNYKLVEYLFEDPKEEDMTKEEVEKMIAARKPTLTEIMDATGDQWIVKYTGLPEWAKPEVRELIQMGAIRGTKLGDTVEDTEINASLNTYIRPCIVALRIAKELNKQAPKDALAAQMERVVEFLRGETE